jgi:hypothetical protein
MARRRVDGAAALEGNHPAQQLADRDWWVRVAVGISADDQAEMRALGLDSNQPVGKETRRPLDEDHVSHGQIGQPTPVDGQHVTRPDRGPHARAERAQPHRAEPAEDLGDERPSRIRDQEFFLFNRHCAMVPLIFPQASAIVSNSCSRTNAGLV